MADVQAAHPQWFSPETMAWWDSRIETELLCGVYFITSERMGDLPGRVYTIRRATGDRTIATVGEFGEYGSVEDARFGLARHIHLFSHPDPDPGTTTPE